MHSCDAAPPPVQGAALLLELGTLIIEGRATPRHPANPQPPSSTTVVSATAPTTTQNTYSRANSVELQPSPERFHSRKNSFGSQDQRSVEDPEQSNYLNTTNATIKDTNNTTASANTASFAWHSVEQLINLNTSSAAASTATFARLVSGEQSNCLNTSSAAAATASFMRHVGIEQSNNLIPSSATAAPASFVKHACAEQSNNLNTSLEQSNNLNTSSAAGGGGSSDDGEGLRRREDMHRKLLSALLGAKIYQRVQFGNGEEEQEKVCISGYYLWWRGGLFYMFKY